VTTLLGATPKTWRRADRALTDRQPDLPVVARSQGDKPRLTTASCLCRFQRSLRPMSFERDLVTKCREFAPAVRDHWLVSINIAV